MKNANHSQIQPFNLNRSPLVTEILTSNIIVCHKQQAADKNQQNKRQKYFPVPTVFSGLLTFDPYTLLADAGRNNYFRDGIKIAQLFFLLENFRIAQTVHPLKLKSTI